MNCGSFLYPLIVILSMVRGLIRQVRQGIRNALSGQGGAKRPTAVIRAKEQAARKERARAEAAGPEIVAGREPHRGGSKRDSIEDTVRAQIIFEIREKGLQKD